MRLEDSIDKDTYETEVCHTYKTDTLLPTARNCRKQPRTKDIKRRLKSLTTLEQNEFWMCSIAMYLKSICRKSNCWRL